MTNWLPRRDALRRPIYLALADHIGEAVEDGRIAPGERLPTHRSLAHDLSISIQTVSRAYEELVRRGIVVGEVGRGTFVHTTRSDPAPPYIPEGRREGLIDLSILKPVGEQIHIDRMKVALAGLVADLPSTTLFSFRPNVVQKRDREIAVAWLERCGVETTPDRIQLTNGATPAMAVALTSAAPAGSLVLTETIGHHTLIPLAGYLGFRLQGIEIDDDGIVPEAFAEACDTNDAKVLVITPSAANPTVAMTSRARREALVAIARSRNVLIIENDAWGPLVEDRPPPIAAFAPERTFYITSLTKCVMPGLRVGYLVPPETLISSAANRNLVTNWIATPLIAEIASRWITDGTAWELLEWQRAALRARHIAADAVLGNLPRNQHRNSLHIWLPLPPIWREDAFVAQARSQGVAVAPGTAFATEPSVATTAIRVSVGPTSVDELCLGLEIVARLVKSVPEPALLAM